MSLGSENGGAETPGKPTQNSDEDLVASDEQDRTSEQEPSSVALPPN